MKKYILAIGVLFFGLVGYGQDNFWFGGIKKKEVWICIKYMTGGFSKGCDSNSKWMYPIIKDSAKAINGLLSDIEWRQEREWMLIRTFDSIIRRRERTIEYLKKQGKSGSGISAVGGVLHPGPGRMVDSLPDSSPHAHPFIGAPRYPPVKSKKQ